MVLETKTDKKFYANFLLTFLRGNKAVTNSIHLESKLIEMMILFDLMFYLAFT